MYFPVLRGKQYEMQALEELAEVIIENKNIFPIIEPMNCNSLTKRILSNLNEQGIPLVILINPQNGDLQDCCSDIKSELIDILSADVVTIGIYIDSDTSFEDIEEYMNNCEGYTFALYHLSECSYVEELKDLIKSTDKVIYQIFEKTDTSKRYRREFKDSKRVIIEDPFRIEKRNADYGKFDDYSAMIYNYSKDYFGFGDYQMIGSRYSDSGGPAHAVALHLTEEDAVDEEIGVVHFVSDDTKGAHNIQKKYFQALKKLCKYVEDSKGEPITLGEKGYHYNLNVDKKFHGLGYPKKLSIMHHVHLFSMILGAQ